MIRVWATFVCAALTLAGIGVAHADEPLPGTPIPFKRLDDPAIKKFAWSFFAKDRRDDSVDWAGVFPNHVLYSLYDLNNDGVPELLLIVDKAEWCGEVGCWSDIFRKTSKGYELICICSLPPPLPDGRYGPRLLPQTENGYHVIDAAESIIHWHAKQKYNSGRLCYAEEFTR